MQRALRTALAQKTRLAALGTAVSKINHDLRNILASAMAGSDRLDQSQDPEAPPRHAAPARGARSRRPVVQRHPQFLARRGERSEEDALPARAAAGRGGRGGARSRSRPDPLAQRGRRRRPGAGGSRSARSGAMNLAGNAAEALAKGGGLVAITAGGAATDGDRGGGYRARASRRRRKRLFEASRIGAARGHRAGLPIAARSCARTAATSARATGDDGTVFRLILPARRGGLPDVRAVDLVGRWPAAVPMSACGLALASAPAPSRPATGRC